MGTSAGDIRAGRAFVELFTEDSKLVRGLRASGDKLKAWGSRVNAIGAAVLASGVGLISPLLTATKMFSDAGSVLVDASGRTGASVMALSTLGFAAEQTGTALEVVEVGMTKAQKTIAAAAGGSKKARAALDDLGLSADKLAKLHPEDQFRAIAEKIAAIKNPTLRAAAAISIFGKAGTKLLPMISDLKALEDRARSLGLEWTQNDAQAADAFGDALGELWTTVKMGVNMIGASLAPVLIDFVNRATEVVSTVVKWIKANRGFVVSALKIAAIVVAIGASLTGLGFVLGGAGAALGVAARGAVFFGRALGLAFGAARMLVSLLGTSVVRIVAVLSSSITKLGAVIWGVVVKAGAALAGGLSAAFAVVATPIGLISVAVLALGGYFLYASGLIGQAIEGLKGLFGELHLDALAAFEGIRDALAAGDLTAAMEVLLATFKLVWQRLVNYAEELWINFKAFFLSVWANAVANLAGLFTNAWAGLQQGWLETTDFLADAWAVFSDFVMQNWNTVIGFIQKAWVRLKSLFDKDINVDAELTRINKDTAERNRTSEDQRDATIGDRDRARQKERAAIEAGRLGALDDIEAQRDRDQKARDSAREQALADSEQAVRDAEERRDKAIADAKDKRNKVEASQKLKDRNGKPVDLPDLKDAAGAAKKGLAFDDVRSKEGFKSVAQALQKARDRDAQDMARNTAKLASNSDKQLAELEDIHDELADDEGDDFS